jgi:hypothetical protein
MANEAQRGGWILAVGVIIGLVLGGLVPPMPLHGSTAATVEGFSVVTAELEPGQEGIYYLDYQTGDLVGAFLHPRSGKFINLYKYNILKDFADAKTPKFMMVSSSTPMIFPQGNIRPSVGIVYVVEVTSGIACAYAAPYATNRDSIPAATNETLRLVDKIKFRSGAIRDK